MNPEFWAIIGVGIALAGLQWRLYATLNTRMDRMETRIDTLRRNVHERFDTLQRNVNERLNDLDRRLARIEGWIAGRFGEEPVASA